MKYLLPCFLAVLLVSCTTTISTPTTVPTSTFTNTPEPPTVTPTSTSTVTPLPPTDTPTPEICDPFAADFCITDGHFIFQRPIHLPDNTFIDPTYAYGSTANGTRDPHHGVELLNKFGTPVYAAADGVVIFAGADDQAIFIRWTKFYGNLIVIQHADGVYSLYAHLSKIDVQKDQPVTTGQKIGEVGQTGVATGSHLHFEVRQGDVNDYYATQNPELWLVPNESTNGRLGVLQLSIMTDTGQLVRNTKFTLEYARDQNAIPGRDYYGSTYAPELLTGTENAVLGDVGPGWYRIAFTYNGILYQRMVEVQSGRLTQVIFIVK